MMSVQAGKPPLSAETAPAHHFRLLFVDDEPAILSSLKRLMWRHPYDCWFVTSGAEGLEVLESQRIDLIISDMRMPEMDGAAFLAEVRRRWPFSVRFLMTGYADMNAAVDALNLGGINRYISKPWDDNALLEAIEEGLRIRRLEREKKRLLDKSRQQNEELKQLNETLESRVKARTQEVRDKSAQLKKAFRQLENSYDSFVRIFSSVIANRPQLVKGQSREVADLARQIANAMDQDVYQTRYIYYAALLHEVGKLNLTDDILSRPETQLTHREIREYQQYPVLGELTLMPIKALKKSALLIRHHNELMDGSGYPDRLRGEDIPMGARIIKAARDYIGLQTHLLRPAPVSSTEALRYLKEESGKRYDPDVVATLEPIVKGLSLNPVQSYESRISVSDLKPDMTLARDLVNKKGIVLMVKGSRLTTAMIDRLKQIEALDNHRIKVYVHVHVNDA